LKKKYLAYLALLAGWIIFCYWLYAKELFPRFHGQEETNAPLFIKDLALPLAFNWGSDAPLAGKGWDEWIEGVKKADSLKSVFIITGFYFRDEEISILLDEALARSRVDRLVQIAKLNPERTMVRVMPQEINADVKSNPFEAIGIEQIALSDVLRLAGDTLEMCFPLKDSFDLPPFLLNRVDAWLDSHSAKKDGQCFVVGIADGSGIAESADVALDRAEVIKKVMIENGWKEEHIQLSTGQRDNPRAVRNRCVIVYFE
jgi:hypothetical protein